MIFAIVFIVQVYAFPPHPVVQTREPLPAMVWHA